MFGSGEEDSAKVFFPGVTGGGRRERAEELFGLLEEGRPVSLLQVYVGLVFAFGFFRGFVR
jgi:hypothetical protein